MKHFLLVGMRKLRRLKCRLFHFELWTALKIMPGAEAGRFCWLRCPIDNFTYSFKYRIPVRPSGPKDERTKGRGAV